MPTSSSKLVRISLETKSEDDMLELMSKTSNANFALRDRSESEFLSSVNLNFMNDLRFGDAYFKNGFGVKGQNLPQDMMIIMPRAGEQRYFLNRSEADINSRTGLIINSAACDEVIFSDNTVQNFMMISIPSVNRTFELFFEKVAPPNLYFNLAFSLDSGHGIVLSHIYAALNAHGSHADGEALSPKLAQLLRDAAIMTVIENVPGAFPRTLEASTIAAAPWQIRRAMEFVVGHVEGPLSVQDVAEEIGIGIRALQLGFRRYNGHTPQQFIRSVRLTAVRRELLDPTSRRSIAAIARHWGFANSTRFAWDYEKAFGERPSKTRGLLR